MNVQLYVRERPTRGQIFQGRGRGGFDALGVKTAETKLTGKGHGKATAQRCGDQFIWVGSDTLDKRSPMRILRLPKNAAFGSQCPFALMKVSFPNSGSVSVHELVAIIPNINWHAAAIRLR